MTTNVASLSQPSQKTGGLNVALWIVQGLLFAGFAMGGTLKSLTPLDQLALKMPWVNAMPGWLVRFIGVSELAGAIGLILPSLTRIKPWLTPLAGAALALVMLLAMGLHVSRGELSALPINLTLGGLAAFVVWGRSTRARLARRG